MIHKRKYPWIGTQDWKDIVFIHWSVEPKLLRPFIPSAFELELFDHKAWVSVVMFKAIRTKGRMTPKFTALREYDQMNIRTYVKYKNAESGVYFIDIFSNSTIMNQLGKSFLSLPFQKSTFSWSSNEISVTNFISVKFDLENTYVKDPLSTFLTERYCIWTVKGNKVLKIPIVHKRWQLQRLNATIKQLSISSLERITNRDSVVSYYCPYQHAKLFPYETNR